MANRLYKQMQGQQARQAGGPVGMIQRFNQFRQEFTGDPDATLQGLLKSGQLTQEQYNAAYAKASALLPFISKL